MARIGELRARRAAWGIARSSHENPARAHEHQGDENRKGEQIGELGVGVITDDRDDLADDEGGDEAADHVAEPAEHADHENERAERVADKGMNVVLQQQEARRQSGERAADRRSHKINAPLVDAHQADDVAVLRDGADCCADKGALEEEIERDRADKRYREGQQARGADIDFAELDDRQPNAEVAEVGAEQQRGETLEKEQQTAGGEKLIDRRRTEYRRDDQDMHQNAEYGHTDDGHGARQQQWPTEP